MEKTSPVSVLPSVADEVKKTILRLDAQAQLVLFGSRARAHRYHISASSDSDWDFLHHLELKTDAVTIEAISSNFYKAVRTVINVSMFTKNYCSCNVNE